MIELWATVRPEAKSCLIPCGSGGARKRGAKCRGYSRLRLPPPKSI